MTALTDGESPTPGTLLHRLSARTLLIATLLFAVVVVATPREWIGVFAIYTGLVIAGLIVARVRPAVLGRRLLIDLPFLVFAALLPFIALGPRVSVGPLSLSVEGLWGAWGLVIKATLAIAAVTVLTATTSPRHIIEALRQLRLPAVMTSIMAFMVRYLEIIVGEIHRMRIARESRGFRARGPGSWRVLAQAAGASVIRAHARGERVHLAMLARGGEG